MAMRFSKALKKLSYEKRVGKFMEDYGRVLVVGADNLEANQLRNIRKGFGEGRESVVLLGKNSLIRRSIKNYASSSDETRRFHSLVPLLLGNVGLVFTRGDLKEASDVYATYKFGAPAHICLDAPIEEIASPVDSSQASSLQVLTILKFFTSFVATYPRLAETPYTFVNADNETVAISAITEYYRQPDQLKEFLEGPSRFPNNASPASTEKEEPEK